jgi:hypothetical protein
MRLWRAARLLAAIGLVDWNPTGPTVVQEIPGGAYADNRHGSLTPQHPCAPHPL